MTNNVNERDNFGSKLGVILATAGSAVGLGNVWRFPYMAGENGGAVFIIIYVVCVLMLGIPSSWGVTVTPIQHVLSGSWQEVRRGPR